MKKMYVVYALLTIGLAVAGVLVSQGDLMIMVDSPSLALLLVPTIFMLLSHYGPKEFIRAFQVAMAKTSAGEKELKNALLFFSTAQAMMIASTIVAVFLGIIMILDSIGKGQPQSARTVAWWMAVDFVSILYLGFGLLLITVPFKSAVQKRLNDLES